MNRGQMKELLCALLDCGYRDLDVLEDCAYDMGDLIEDCKEMGYEKPDLNALAYAMMERAKDDMREWIDDRMEKVKESMDDEEDEEKLNQLEGELAALEDFDPYENVESFHNFLDTSAWIVSFNNEWFHYLQGAFDVFQEKTGYTLV